MTVSRYGKYADRAAFDAAVKHLYDQGRDDLRISISTELSRKAVGASRRRQGLPTLFAPGGRPSQAWKSRGMAPR
jgi:hypothetical protein